MSNVSRWQTRIQSYDKCTVAAGLHENSPNVTIHVQSETRPNIYHEATSAELLGTKSCTALDGLVFP